MATDDSTEQEDFEFPPELLKVFGNFRLKISTQSIREKEISYLKRAKENLLWVALREADHRVLTGELLISTEEDMEPILWGMRMEFENKLRGSTRSRDYPLAIRTAARYHMLTGERIETERELDQMVTYIKKEFEDDLSENRETEPNYTRLGEYAAYYRVLTGNSLETLVDDKKPENLFFWE